MVLRSTNTSMIGKVFLCALTSILVGMGAFGQGIPAQENSMRFQIKTLELYGSSAYGNVINWMDTSAVLNYRAGVNSSTTILGLPFQFSYGYGNNAGLSYIKPSFRFGLDKQAMTKIPSIDTSFLEDSVKRLMNGLDESILQQQQQLNARRRMLDEYTQMQLPDTSLPEFPDSLAPEFMDTQHLSSASDSLVYKVSTQRARLDSLIELRNKYRQTLDLVRNRELQMREISLRKRFIPKNLELGVISPRMGVYILSGSVLRGFNVEMEGRHFSHHLALGQLNSFMLNPASGSGILSLEDRFNNMIRLRSHKTDRSMLAYKLQRGSADSSHFYGTILLARGKRNIYHATDETAQNAVVEIAKGIAIKDHALIIFSVAQSFLRETGNNIFDESSTRYKANEAGHGFHVNIRGKEKSHSLTYFLHAEYLTPTFTSFGIGVQRRDYLRVNAQLTRRTKKNAQWKIGYRRDQSNLLRSGTLNMKTENYRLGYARKFGRKNMLHTDLLYITSAICSPDFASSEQLYISNVVYTRILKGGSNSPVFTSSYNVTIASAYLTRHQSDNKLSFNPGKNTQLSFGLLARHTQSPEESWPTSNLTTSCDISGSVLHYSVFAGGGWAKRKIDWTAGASIQRNKGRLFLSVSLEKIFRDDMILYPGERWSLRAQNPWRATIDATYKLKT